ncbi:pyridoxal phosphate-dependent aminotransferase [Anoxybacterium hadale]|uniref:Pyridoxal phosphate-dependent aminotransferase n=2 Tax=Anoxybacterium hadale TaxID=3408580 RepID=A0ACD1AI73_9FIRM|nr:pyridoxal phosphate-dependent aminotransferase [Clostridiales bacterium]
MTLAIADKAREMKLNNIDVISFATGEPDFDTPVQIKEEAIKWTQRGYTKYVASDGIPELKEAIRQKLLRENKLEYAASEILVCNGAKQAIYEAFGAILNPGDEVIIPAPCYVSYIEQVKIFDGVPVIVPTKEEDNFRLKAEDIGKKITDRTKAIVLNSPNNPTGAVIQKEELRKIACLAVENQLFVISDEVYELLVYNDNECFSIAAFDDAIKKLTITVNSLSKSYCMTGWRVGYAAGDEEVISAMSDIHGHMTGNVNSIAQKAGVEAIANYHNFETMIEEYKQRRDLMVKRLNGMPGIHCKSPDGAFYTYTNVMSYYGKIFGDKVIRNSYELAEFLLEQAHVACVPGEAFGMDGYIRFTFAIARERLMEGLDRVESALKLLR